MSSPNLKFTEDSEQLWHGNVNHRTALGYDAARVLIEALDSQTVKDKVTRSSLQAVIADSGFHTQGAIGTIRFTANGNRRKPFVELVTVAQCDSSRDKLAFIPLNYDRCF